MMKLLHGVFALLLLAAVVSAAPFNEDDWVEDSHMPKEEAMLTVAQRYENATPLNTILVEHIATLTKDDIRKAVTETAHETGLIHYQFEQFEQEIEEQVESSEAVLKAISVTLTADQKDFLIDKAIVAGAYIADAAGGDAAGVMEKMNTKYKAEFMKMKNKHMWLMIRRKPYDSKFARLVSNMKDAVLMGITKVLIFLTTLDPKGTGATTVALMKKIDALDPYGKYPVVSAIGELAKKTADGVALKAETLELYSDGSLTTSSIRALGKADKAQAANLEKNLAKLIGKVAVPLFCKQARSMAYVILDKERVKESYEQNNPKDLRAKAMKVAGWAKDPVAIGTANLILYSMNYLPECVDVRETDCRRIMNAKGDQKAYDKCKQTVAESYTAPKKWVGIKDSK